MAKSRVAPKPRTTKRRVLSLKDITITWPGDPHDDLGKRTRRITGEELAVLLTYHALRIKSDSWKGITDPDDWHGHLRGLAELAHALAACDNTVADAERTLAWITEDFAHRLEGHLLQGGSLRDAVVTIGDAPAIEKAVA